MRSRAPSRKHATRTAIGVLVATLAVGVVVTAAAPAFADGSFTLTVQAPAAAPRAGAFFVSGSVAPLAPGHPVLLQREEGSGWKTLAATTLSPASTYALSAVAPEHQTDLRLRVYVLAAPGVSAGSTPTFTVRVSGGALKAGHALHGNQSVLSSDGHYRLTMHGNGNLVLTPASSHRALWSSDTAGHRGAVAVMRADGDFLVAAKDGSTLWETGTSGSPGASLVVASDGNLAVLTRAGDAAIWVSGSTNDVIGTGERLLPNQYLDSADGLYRLTMQLDGNMVLTVASTSQVVWQTGTQGNVGATLLMQPDGDLVLSAADGASLWSTETAGRPGASLVVEAGGRVEVLAPDDAAPAWSGGVRRAGVMWGVDSVDMVDSILPLMDSPLGRPDFFGRYIWTLTPAEIQRALAAGVRIMLIDNDGTSGQLGYRLGERRAVAAIARAKALGAPRGVAIFRDVETGSAIDTAFVRGWYDAFAADGTYFAGFYGNPINGLFSGAFCGAVRADAHVGSTFFFSSEPEPGRGPKAKAPAWAPAVPPCAAQTVAWQYGEPGGDSATSYCGRVTCPNVDTDEARADAPFWSRP